MGEGNQPLSRGDLVRVVSDTLSVPVGRVVFVEDGRVYGMLGTRPVRDDKDWYDWSADAGIVEAVRENKVTNG